MVNSLNLYGTITASTTIATANTLVSGTGATALTRTTKIGTSTGFGELWSQGNTAVWTAGGSLGTLDGHGWLYDTTALEGNVFPAGNWTPTWTLSVSVGSIVATLTERIFKYNAGVYTQI